MQTRLESLKESLHNIWIGSGVALLTQLIVFPLEGIHIQMHTNIKIWLYFTVVSVARSYTIRRWHNLKSTNQR